ncbi:MAG: hypothetical protein ABI175_18385, partial [Polyangiales bacterium]
EAQKDDGEVGAKAADAKGTPPQAEVAKPVDPSMGKSVKVGGGAWTVTRADSLWRIADITYGSGTYWNEIKKANKAKVHGPTNIIRDNDVLVLPVLDIPTMKALKNFADQPEQLRDLVVNMTPEEYEGFLANTKQPELEKNAELLQAAEMMRSTGMTPDEMAGEQLAFLEEEAKKKGVTVGEYVKEVVAKKGYGGGTAVDWNKNSPAQKKAWHDRFKKLIVNIKASAPPDVKGIIKDSESKGGSFVWNPDETEALGAFAYTSGDWSLHCGTRFVEVGEKDPSVVFANIAHEMGGHNYYGDTQGGGIQDGALGKMSEEDRTTAESSGNHMHSAYGYMETEIFAELYEFRYDSDKNPTDHPFAVDPKGNDMTKSPKRAGDVKNQLTRIKEAFAPKIAEGLVRGLARRVAIDPRIMAEAKTLFKADVLAVLGIKV